MSEFQCNCKTSSERTRRLLLGKSSRILEKEIYSVALNLLMQMQPDVSWWKCRSVRAKSTSFRLCVHSHDRTPLRFEEFRFYIYTYIYMYMKTPVNRVNCIENCDTEEMTPPNEYIRHIRFVWECYLSFSEIFSDHFRGCRQLWNSMEP